MKFTHFLLFTTAVSLSTSAWGMKEEDIIDRSWRAIVIASDNSMDRDEKLNQAFFSMQKYYENQDKKDYDQAFQWYSAVLPLKEESSNSLLNFKTEENTNKDFENRINNVKKQIDNLKENPKVYPEVSKAIIEHLLDIDLDDRIRFFHKNDWTCPELESLFSLMKIAKEEPKLFSEIQKFTTRIISSNRPDDMLRYIIWGLEKFPKDECLGKRIEHIKMWSDKYPTMGEEDVLVLIDRLAYRLVGLQTDDFTDRLNFIKSLITSEEPYVGYLANVAAWPSDNTFLSRKELFYDLKKLLENQESLEPTDKIYCELYFLKNIALLPSENMNLYTDFVYEIIKKVRNEMGITPAGIEKIFQGIITWSADETFEERKKVADLLIKEEFKTINQHNKHFGGPHAGRILSKIGCLSSIDLENLLKN